MSDSLNVTVQKMDLHEGDLILLSTPIKLNEKQMIVLSKQVAALREDIKRVSGKNVLISFTDATLNFSVFRFTDLPAEVQKQFAESKLTTFAKES